MNVNARVVLTRTCVTPSAAELASAAASPQTPSHGQVQQPAERFAAAENGTAEHAQVPSSFAADAPHAAAGAEAGRTTEVSGGGATAEEQTVDEGGAGDADIGSASDHEHIAVPFERLCPHDLWYVNARNWEEEVSLRGDAAKDERFQVLKQLAQAQLENLKSQCMVRAQQPLQQPAAEDDAVGPQGD